MSNGNVPGVNLRRVRDFIRGHGVVSTREVRAALGANAARTLIRQTNRGEFDLIGRGVSALPGLGMRSPEYAEFLHRRRSSASGAGAKNNDRLVAWASERGTFTPIEAKAELGAWVSNVLDQSLAKGDIVRVARGVYACRRTDATILRPRIRIPQSHFDSVRRIAASRTVFTTDELDIPAERRGTVLKAMVTMGEIVRIERCVYGLAGHILDPDQARMLLTKAPVRRPYDVDQWLRDAGTFTMKDALTVLGKSCSSLLYRRCESGVLKRVSRGRYEWAGPEPQEPGSAATTEST